MNYLPKDIQSYIYYLCIRNDYDKCVSQLKRYDRYALKVPTVNCIRVSQESYLFNCGDCKRVSNDSQIWSRNIRVWAAWYFQY